ncbi:hypothetical protein [Glycomyces salinus]|uniref:hypothetical protein n=1 Tax=Glycomyces salinus TaxID=980294 RepID=UPI0018EC12BF|nr:hypothetical protein [Glycomyces salinus]
MVIRKSRLFGGHVSFVTLRKFFSGSIFKNLWTWTLVEFAIVPLPLIAIGLIPPKESGEAFSNEFWPILYLAGGALMVGIVTVILPCAIVSERRFKMNSPKRMHFIPYLGLGVYAVIMIRTMGMLFGLLLVPQFVVVFILHLLMARQYRNRMGSIRGHGVPRVDPG